MKLTIKWRSNKLHIPSENMQQGKSPLNVREQNGYALPKHVTATPEASISGKEKGGNEEFRHVYMYVARICSYKNIGDPWLPLPLAPPICQAACLCQLQIFQLFVSKLNSAFIPVLQVYSWSIVLRWLLSKCSPTTAVLLQQSLTVNFLPVLLG